LASGIDAPAKVAKKETRPKSIKKPWDFWRALRWKKKIQPRRRFFGSDWHLLCEYLLCEYLLCEYLLCEYLLCEYLLCEYLLCEYLNFIFSGTAISTRNPPHARLSTCGNRKLGRQPLLAISLWK
jgi:hypothetical protein